MKHCRGHQGIIRKSILICFVLMFTLSFARGIWAGTKHALLIGIQDYQLSGLKSLRGPGNDLQIIKKVLLNKFKFQEKNITLSTGKQATHTGLEKAFSRFAREIKKGDFIYIHYSGHGSQIKDESGDEHPRPFDQTWVSYGSRSKKMQGKDQYDIVDDELYEWLLPIFKKTGHVVFVSDSCHSASVTRGNAPVARSVPIDTRQYPFLSKTLKYEEYKNGIFIGAVQDAGKAYETSFNGKTHGVFSWYWAKALQQARPGETWQDLYKRVKVKVTGRYNTQYPQIHGNSEILVFGGNFKKTSPRIPISKVRQNGKKVRIEIGTLSGVTRGSIYRKYDAREKDKTKLPYMEITNVKSIYSEAAANGAFKVGDLVIEELHAYHTNPIRIFINGDLVREQDKDLITRVRGIFKNRSPGNYKLTGTQQESDIVLYMLRPKQKNGKWIKQEEADTLPKSYPDQPPEVWILDNGEKLLFDDLRIPFSDFSKGAKLLEANIKAIIRFKDIENLTSDKSINVDFSTIVWQPAANPGQVGPDYLELPENKGWFKKQGVYNREQMAEKQVLPYGSLVTFKLKNNSKVNYYMYLLSIMRNGRVRAIFPAPFDGQHEALLPAGKERDLKDIVLLHLDDPGREMIKLIVTGTPIDISLLEHETFKTRGGEKANMNPLEQLLTNAVHGIRSPRTRVYCTGWGTQQYSLVVRKEDDKK